ncbi:hypothetical protein B0H19DRAFT_1275075 [Mycena capillaripes]|nr:hypothetical protein B0H19DRAFT_1275075 [Mycena capillaripes]
MIDLENAAHYKGWPMEVDFDVIADRVSATENAVLNLVCESGNPIWHTFLKDINHQVNAFSERPRDFVEETRMADFTGYFGPRGMQGITDAVDDLLSGRLDQDQIVQTVGELVDTPHPWDEANDQCALLSKQDFIDCIVVPFIATALISEDLEIDFLPALEAFEESNELGAMFRTDPRLPLPQKKTRLEAPTGSKNKSKPAITLDNFPPVWSRLRCNEA